MGTATSEDLSNYACGIINTRGSFRNNRCINVWYYVLAFGWLRYNYYVRLYVWLLYQSFVGENSSQQYSGVHPCVGFFSCCFIPTVTLNSIRRNHATRCFNWKGKFFLARGVQGWGNPEIHPQGRFSDQCLKIRIGYLIQVNELDILHLYILPILLSYRNGNWVHITLLRLLTHYYLEKK